MNIAKKSLQEAHKHCKHNKRAIAHSDIVACFYCMRLLEPKEVKKWVDTERDTGVCPHCSVDALLASSSGLPIDKMQFLGAMHDHWFSVATGERKKS